VNSAQDVVAFMTVLEQRFLAAKDRRGVFASAYLQITLAVAAKIREGFFQDNAWTERYLAAFARLYKDALDAWDRGDQGGVPKAWRIAFQANTDRTSTVLQDLILGVNAHVNHDLPLALFEVGIEPDREMRHADHTAVNEVLRAATDKLQESVEARYAPVLRAFDLAAGRFDENVANFSVTKAREEAWRAAEGLTDARSDIGRLARRAAIDMAAGLFARLVLLPTRFNPALRRALQQIDSISVRA